MTHTKTTAIAFTSILKKAKSGDYKLPAFQRRWKWTTRQVMGLYESLRLGYPIGALLFLTSSEGQKLNPRPFHGSGRLAAGNPENESLVLDGQQRITAGLSIYYGLEGEKGSEYYIDSRRVNEKLTERKINIDDEVAVENFCRNLDLEDGYLAAKQQRPDRSTLFVKSGLIWTAYLTDERQAEFDELLDDVSDKKQKDVIRKVIKKHLRPNTHIQVPIIELGTEFDLAAISKVFSTINSSGKLLTPFELVVAILYPDDIRLEDDINEYRSRYRHYKHMDRNGEVLLQLVAMLSGKSPKKSDLPKNIDHVAYRAYAAEAAHKLEKLGEFLTKSVGCGLDVTDKLTPYDSIFAPMAIVLSQIEENIQTVSEKSAAKQKLLTWFVGAAIGQRYQEGIHNKQSQDVGDFSAWIENKSDRPTWLKNTTITRVVKTASPSGAIGRIFTCLMNRNHPKDPVINTDIGFGQSFGSAQIHHIYPTKWAPKGLREFDTSRTETNLALNTMLLHPQTNSDWLNFDPKNQLEISEKTLGKVISRERYVMQLMNDKCLETMSKADKSARDYEDFIDARYAAFVKGVAEFGIVESKENIDVIELDDPSIIE